MSDVLVTLSLSSSALTAACPGCRQQTGCGHSRYTRAARDLPIQGCPVRLYFTVRRFFCRKADCPGCVFCVNNGLWESIRGFGVFGFRRHRAERDIPQFVLVLGIQHQPDDVVVHR
ncbi:transposase family protein [Thalassoroseus pseudoceratinae]|uniref:transposase family protein n=1 Tax=Thalassoroseus pseudoceratinae TaxID=2713176 RepID=UPI001420BBAC